MSDNLENTALKEAHGVYNDGVTSKNARYDLYMDYDNMHNIVSKKQQISQTGVQFAGSLNAGYELNYTINAHNSQQIANIADESYRYEGTKLETPPAAAVVKKSQVYSYDANGNMTYMASGKKLNDSTLQATSTRQLLWDEENRLLGISDNGFVSNYWYDAAGERTVKQSGGSEGVFVNGVLSGANTETGKFTAYVSPYLVVSNGGNYSKHIYMGSQRIVSKLSNSGIFAASPVTATQQQAKYALQSHKIKERFDSLGVVYTGTPQTGGLISSNPATTASSYFYHPDHLGSSSLITYATGALTQHIQYVPFGEVFVEERTNSWSTPYKFNGKELDEETGLYYYHARYYDPRLSVWMSVDPLAEKYLNVSSYVYCANNPVKYVDPDGKRIVDSNGKTIFHNGKWIGGSIGSRIIGEAMMLTPIGRNLFNQLDKALFPVQLRLLSVVNNDDNATVKITYVNGRVAAAIINIYLGNCNLTLNEVNKYKDIEGDFVSISKSDKIRFQFLPISVNEIIGQKGVHETTHILDNGSQKKYQPDYNAREMKPIDNEIISIIETVNYNRIERVPLEVILKEHLTEL